MTTDTDTDTMITLRQELKAIKNNKKMDAFEKADASKELIEEYIEYEHDGVIYQDDELILLHENAENDETWQSAKEELTDITGVVLNDTGCYLEVKCRNSKITHLSSKYELYDINDLRSEFSDQDTLKVYGEYHDEALSQIKLAKEAKDELTLEMWQNILEHLEEIGLDKKADYNMIILDENCSSWEVLGENGKIDKFTCGHVEFSLQRYATIDIEPEESDFEDGEDCDN